MEARILLVSLLPSLALVCALAVGAGGAGAAPTASTQVVDRVGITEVSPAEAERAQEHAATSRTEGPTAHR